MFAKITTGLLVAFVSVLMSAAAARGVALNTLYANAGRGDSTLYTLDDRGQATAVGPMGVANITDIAFCGGTLYGITASKFYQIDPNTGAASLVGPLHFGGMDALAADPVTGTIYAAGGDGFFITIDPVTGAGTKIGSLGTVEKGKITSGGDLAIDPQGARLYASVHWGHHGTNDYLATIDPLNGAATIIGTIGFDQVHGLAFKDGILYGVTDNQELLRLDLLTGRGTMISNTGIGPHGLTASPVPVPNALWLLGSGCIYLVCWGRRRGNSRRHWPGSRCPAPPLGSAASRPAPTVKPNYETMQ
jgi:hypothetical protein